MVADKVKYASAKDNEYHKHNEYESNAEGSLRTVFNSPNRELLTYCPYRQRTGDKYASYLKEPVQ